VAAHELPDGERLQSGLGCQHVRLHDQGAHIGDLRRLRRSRRAERGHVRRLLVHEVPPQLCGDGQSREGNRALKQRLVAEGVAHAALVYDGDRASPGRSSDHPRSYPTSITEGVPRHCRATARLPGHLHPGAGLRGQGLAAIALRGAVELIAQAGGGLVEGYPHDTAGVRKKNSSFLYNGTRTMYEREGFTYDRPKGQGNCVMVREVAPSTRG
jgi:hypothetical protein